MKVQLNLHVFVVTTYISLNKILAQFRSTHCVSTLFCVPTEAPPPHEHYDADAGIKRVTEYFVDDDGKKIKV